MAPTFSWMTGRSVPYRSEIVSSDCWSSSTSRASSATRIRMSGATLEATRRKSAAPAPAAARWRRK